jgi:hypothetical protein
MTTTFVQQNIPNNLTNVILGMPLKPDTMVQGNDFSKSRAAFLRGAFKPLPTPSLTNSENNSTCFTSSTSGERTAQQNVLAARSSFNIQSKPMTFTSGADNNIVNSAVRRVRGGGCVAPKKKGLNKN